MELCMLCDYFIGALLNTIRVNLPIKSCIKHQQMHLNFGDVTLLYFGQHHVSATHVTMYKVISLKTRIQLGVIKMSTSLNSFKNHNFVQNSVLNKFRCIYLPIFYFIFSTVNFNHKLYDFLKLRSDSDPFYS